MLNLNDPAMSYWLKEQIQGLGNRDIVDAINDIETLLGEANRRLSEITRSVGDSEKEPLGWKTYKICHGLDRGNMSVFVASKTDPTRAAVYCQFMAEDWYGHETTLSNLAVANALVSLYDCWLAEECSKAITIDMYAARETLNGEWYLSLMNGEYDRDSLKSLLEPHIVAFK